MPENDVLYVENIRQKLHNAGVVKPSFFSSEPKEEEICEYAKQELKETRAKAAEWSFSTQLYLRKYVRKIPYTITTEKQDFYIEALYWVGNGPLFESDIDVLKKDIRTVRMSEVECHIPHDRDIVAVMSYEVEEDSHERERIADLMRKYSDSDAKFDFNENSVLSIDELASKAKRRLELKPGEKENGYRSSHIKQIFSHGVLIYVKPMTVEKRRVFDLANCGSDLLSQADRELISNNSAEYNGYIKRSEALSLVKETRKDGPYPVEWNEWLQRWFIQARELALEFPEIVDEIYDDERFKDDTQPILAPIIQNIVSECPEYIKRFPRAVGRKVM